MFLNPSYRGMCATTTGTTSAVANNWPGGSPDDAISGTVVYGVFYRCSAGLFGAVQIHGGKENVVDNNLFIDCRYAVSFSPWGEAHGGFLQQPHSSSCCTRTWRSRDRLAARATRRWRGWPSSRT